MNEVNNISQYLTPNELSGLNENAIILTEYEGQDDKILSNYKPSIEDINE